jgi:hypothetical protein
MRRHIVIAALVVVTGCSAFSEPSAAPPSAEDAERLSTATPRPLRLDVHVTALPTGARVSGKTNLPDDTTLMLEVRRGPVWTSSNAKVARGAFTVDLLPRQGHPVPPGDYEVEVSTPFGSVQPAEVRAQLGNEYQALTGPLLKRSSYGVGREVEYKTKVNIGGRPSAAADHQARLAAGQQYEEDGRRNCAEIPALAERYTGVRDAPEHARRFVARCVRDMRQGRKDLARQGLVE